MDRASFIQQYIAAFLGTRAAVKYDGNNDPTWKWTSNQPVEDATYIAEKAWDSLQKSVLPSTTATAGNAVTATTGTVYTLTTSSTPDTADPTL